jgi:hypothetical protein
LNNRCLTRDIDPQISQIQGKESGNRLGSTSSIDADPLKITIGEICEICG